MSSKKQLEIPGTERQSIPEIEEAAEKYRAVRDKRMRLTEQEVAAKVNLLQVLIEHENELTPNGNDERVYRYDDEIVILKSGKRNVKVKAAMDGADEEDED